MAEAISEGDVYASRLQVAFARSQAVLQSWLSPKADNGQAAVQENDDDDFRGFSETKGLGTKSEEDDVPNVLRQSRASNEKLLEQILGKKTAQARKKAQQASKSNIAAKHAAPRPSNASKPNESPRLVASDDDDEEGGRAAAFSSRKRARPSEAPTTTNAGQNDISLDQPIEPPDPRESNETDRNVEKATKHKGDGVDQASKTQKKRPGTYLDEILSKKARKKGKKKKPAAASAVAA